MQAQSGGAGPVTAAAVVAAAAAAAPAAGGRLPLPLRPRLLGLTASPIEPLRLQVGCWELRGWCVSTCTLHDLTRWLGGEGCTACAFAPACRCVVPPSLRCTGSACNHSHYPFARGPGGAVRGPPGDAAGPLRRLRLLQPCTGTPSTRAQQHQHARLPRTAVANLRGLARGTKICYISGCPGTSLRQHECVVYSIPELLLLQSGMSLPLAGTHRVGGAGRPPALAPRSAALLPALPCTCRNRRQPRGCGRHPSSRLPSSAPHGSCPTACDAVRYPPRGSGGAPSAPHAGGARQW